MDNFLFALGHQLALNAAKLAINAAHQSNDNAAWPPKIEPTQSEETFYPFHFNTNKIKSYKCGEPNCNKTYTSKSHLDRHISSVHIKRDFEILHTCPECLRTFSQRHNLKRHMKTVHDPTKTYSCDVCSETFKKKHQLSAHMYTHTFVKSFSCPLCDKDFVTLLDRKKHLKHHKTYNCDHCSMVFDHWSNYLKHKKTEHTFSEFICDECGRKFKKRGHIVHHLKTHKARINLKIHMCPYEDCNRTYTRNSNLRQHIKMYHMEIKHVCEVCQAKLSTKAKLTKHMLLHTNPKPRSPIKTKATGRKERKDKGIPKTKTALQISGLVVPPEDEHSSTFVVVNPLCEAILGLPNDE